MITEKNWLEWGVFAFGAIVVGGTLGFLVYDALANNGEPPRLEVAFGQSQQHEGHYSVPVTIHNRGGRTAEQVLVQVTLTVNGEKQETAELQVNFVPRKSKRQGYVTFENDPRAGSLSGRAIGYEQP